jgi:hypothetical protein
MRQDNVATQQEDVINLEQNYEESFNEIMRQKDTNWGESLLIIQ